MTDPLSDREFNACLTAIVSLPAGILIAAGMKPGADRFVPAQTWALRAQDRTTYYVDFVDPSAVSPGEEYTTWVITKHVDISELDVTYFRSRVRPGGLSHDTIPPVSGLTRARSCCPEVAEQRVVRLVLRCADLHLSRSFYIALGFDLRREQHGAGPLHYSAELGSTTFELHPQGSSTASAIRIGLAHPIGPQAIVAVPRCGGSVVREAIEPSGYRVAVLRDPDGNLIDVRVEA